jgi:hypothetical protein
MSFYEITGPSRPLQIPVVGVWEMEPIETAGVYDADPDYMIPVTVIERISGTDFESKPHVRVVSYRHGNQLLTGFCIVGELRAHFCVQPELEPEV